MAKLHTFAATLAASAVLFIPATASAAPVTVNLRIEGPKSTLFEGPITTDVHQVGATNHDPPNDYAPRDCDGVHNSGNPYGYAAPGATATSAADDGAKQKGLAWAATWYPSLSEMFVDNIGSDAPDPGTYWTFLINWKTDWNYGGCTDQLHDGDDVVWSPWDYTNPWLQLTGAPSRAATGESFTVTVLGQDASGNAAPAAGASVGGQTTDAQGHATLSFSDSGVHALKATRTGAVRSNAQTVCVYVPGSGDCGTDKAPSDTGQSTDTTATPEPGPQPAPAVKDTTPPVVHVTSLTPGKDYPVGPRVLSGDVDEAGGIAQVFMRLRATNGGDLTAASKCRWFSGKRGVFTHRTVPCAKARFFRVGPSAKFSYLLPARLRHGKYVLDVKVLDRAYNAGRASVPFGVK